MSFNSSHINLDNYEEYLLLYVDKELTQAQEEMVKAFLLLHPELQTELDILMSTRLPEEKIGFPNREKLLSHQMQKEDIDEQLLSYIDNELTAAEKENLKKQLSTNALYTAELASLLKTKLDPEETIVYPNKQELYRHTAKLISFRMWMQVAAAVVFVVFVSGLYLTETYKDEPSFANNVMPGKPKLNAEPALPQNTAPVNTTSEETETPALATMATIKEATSAEKTVVAPKVRASPAINKPMAVKEPVLVAQTELNLQPIRVAGNTAPEMDLEIHDPVVTSAITASYINQEPRYASTTPEVKQKGSLKGFLRKATRIIEKNTGIGATNEDNELLIGALAVKL